MVLLPCHQTWELCQPIPYTIQCRQWLAAYTVAFLKLFDILDIVTSV